MGPLVRQYVNGRPQGSPLHKMTYSEFWSVRPVSYRHTELGGSNTVPSSINRAII